MDNNIEILGKIFKPYMAQHQIEEKIKQLAATMNAELKGKDVIFLGILNGSFMFAAELMKHISFPCMISFLKIASYQGTVSSGNVKRLIGLTEDIKGKTVVIVEDIIDTGTTLDNIVRQLVGYEPAEIKIATLLLKPGAYNGIHKIDYHCFSIPNDFIIGYGLDYNGYGRNLADIYQIVNS